MLRALTAFTVVQVLLSTVMIHFASASAQGIDLTSPWSDTDSLGPEPQVVQSTDLFGDSRRSSSSPEIQQPLVELSHPLLMDAANQPTLTPTVDLKAWQFRIDGMWDGMFTQTGTSGGFGHQYSAGGNVAISYLFGPHMQLEFGAQAGLQWSFQSDVNAYSLNYGALFNFHLLPMDTLESHWDPFIGAFGGGNTRWGDGQTSATGPAAGGEAGIGYRLTQNTEIALTYRFTWSYLSTTNVNTYDNNIALSFAFRF